MPDRPKQISARALLIDLDDTLYDEGDYVRSGFRAVAREIARHESGMTSDAIYQAMLTELNAKGRGKVFDRALEQVGLEPDPDRVTRLVDLYRNHAPEIGLWPGVSETLIALGRDFRIAIVTDGTEEMQRRKVKALGVEGLVDEVVYCWGLDAPKPSPTPYRTVLQKLAVPAEEAVVIGDNPTHDMAAALAIPCASIRIRTGRFAGQESPEFTATLDLPSFLAVPEALIPQQAGAQS